MKIIGGQAPGSLQAHKPTPRLGLLGEVFDASGGEHAAHGYQGAIQRCPPLAQGVAHVDVRDVALPSLQRLGGAWPTQGRTYALSNWIRARSVPFRNMRSSNPKRMGANCGIVVYNNRCIKMRLGGRFAVPMPIRR